jgi:hypothetical protein
VPAQQWCREMKVIEAFSWMTFVLFSFAFIILNALVSRAQAFGRFDIWWEPIRGEGFHCYMLKAHSQPIFTRVALVWRGSRILQYLCRWCNPGISSYGSVPRWCIPPSTAWPGYCRPARHQWADAHDYSSSFRLSRLSIQYRQ